MITAFASVKINVAPFGFLDAATIAMWSGVPTSAFAAQDCAALANLKIDNTNLLSAAEVPAAGQHLPTHIVACWGMYAAINFEIKLPLQAWREATWWVGGFWHDSEARGFDALRDQRT